MPKVIQSAPGATLRFFIMMALQVGIWGAWAPKLFPFMTLLGFSAGQQSLVGSCWGIAAVIGIFFSNQFADRNFAAERFLAGCHALSALCLLGVAYSQSFLPLFLFYLAYSILYVPTLSVANSLAFANLSDPAREFGVVRAGGTLGWVLVSWPFLFLLDEHATVAQMRYIFIVSAVLSLALAAYSLTLPNTPPRRENVADRLAWRRAIGMLRHPFIAILFVVTLIDSIVHNGYFVIADAFLTNRVGIPSNVSMVVLSLGQIAEIGTMLVLGRVLTKLGWKMTMMMGIVGHVVRFLVFAYAPDAVPFILAAQLLHGVCYAFFFATLYIFVDEAFPPDVRTSAQGLFNLLILGVGMVIASFLFPQLVSALSYQAGSITITDYRQLFHVPAGLAAVGALLLALGFYPPTRRPRTSDEPEAETDMALNSAATPH